MQKPAVLPQPKPGGSGDSNQRATTPDTSSSQPSAEEKSDASNQNSPSSTPAESSPRQNPPASIAQPQPQTGGPAPGVSDAGLTSASTLLGWQLSAANTGLAAKGLSCDSLPVYAGADKPASGTVISQKKITTPLNLINGNITIEQSCIKPTTTFGVGLLSTTDYDNCTTTCPVTSGPVVVRDSEIDGSNVPLQEVAYACAFIGIGTIQRTYIHNTGSGICFYNTGGQLNGSAEGNYVHNLRAYGDPATTGSHNESFTIRDFPTAANPNRRLTVINNRFDSSSGSDTGALFIQTLGDDIDHVTIQGNLLEGYGYQLVLEAGHGNIYGQNMRANNNRFSGTGYGAGYVDDKGLGYGWAEFNNNYLNDPAAANNQGTAVSL
ncbi:MAG TPA: hypothetical protein VFO38_01060 [Candidatus Saccharimonadales bacterium]|nr:hypothetical protein [Candidatus Saccharimonadales bacterium]